MITLIRDNTLIRWKLREVMARQRVSIRKLAEMTQLHRNTIATLRTQDTFPGMEGDTFDKLCRALKCTPFDLIEYIPDEDPKP